MLPGMYSRANMLSRKFGKCSQEVKVRLFKAYCGNSYCGQLWSCVTAQQVQKLKVAYNNAFRIFLGLPWRCSASGMFVENHVYSFGEFTRKEVYNFWSRLISSENLIVYNVVNTGVGPLALYTYDRWVNLLYSSCTFRLAENG